VAKLKMKAFTIVALRKDRKFLIEHLQDSAIAELNSSKEAAEGFTKIDFSSGQQAFERYRNNTEKALKILDDAAPEKTSLLASFAGRREIDPDEIGEIADYADDVMVYANRVIALDKKRTDNAAEAVRIRTALAQLEPWEKLDLPLNAKDTAFTSVIIGSLPELLTDKQLAERLAQDSELAFDFEIVSAAREMTCFVLFVPKTQKAQAEALLRSMGFSYPSVSCKSEPKQEMQSYRDKLDKLTEQSDKALEEIKSYADKREQFKNVYDYFTIRADKYAALSTLDHSGHTVVITGYVPEEDCKKLEAICNRLDCCLLEFEDAPEDAPVKLKNNKFAEPAQNIVTMYASPGVEDIDPTPVLAFFFYFFFGMMFSDAGYGLLMTLACAIMIKKFKPERNMRNNLKLFEYCGISTFIWGLIYGSIFGDAPAVFYNHFTGASLTMKDIIPWPTLDQKKDAMTILILSIALGLIHILAGMACKFYVLWRKGDKKGALFDVGFWMLLLIGVAVAAAGSKLGEPVKKAGIIIALVCVAGLILTQGRDKKNPIMRLFSGIISLYDITGYVSDLLSYSRLLALGLTTGVMAEVFNLLAEMLGSSAIGIIPMTLVFLFGHLITIGLNALGSYVHTMRLQYVEMFAKFYEGGGKPFEPFTLNSKYIRIKEEKKK